MQHGVTAPSSGPRQKYMYICALEAVLCVFSAGVDTHLHIHKNIFTLPEEIFLTVHHPR